MSRRPLLPCDAPNAVQSVRSYSKGYHTHDATSRSVNLEVALPGSFNEVQPQGSLERKNLEVAGSRVFELRNLLSPEECKFLIDFAESESFEVKSDVANEYPATYRNNQRLIIASPELADSLWLRIRSCLTFADTENLTPPGWGAEGIWQPCKVNDMFLLSRYSPGKFFKPHFDGFYRNYDQETSILSVTVYLNADYQGGRLFFRSEGPDGFTAIQFLDGDRQDLLDSKHPIIATYNPEQGSAILFNHDTLHEGETVTSGVKYILRTSVMFRRTQDLSDPERRYTQLPEYQKAKALYESFDELIAKGDTRGFTAAYLAAQELQLRCGGRCIREYDFSNAWPVPFEVSVHIFQYVGFPEVMNCMKVSKAWRAICLSPYLWQFLFRSYWQVADAERGQGFASLFLPSPTVDLTEDWFWAFQNRFLEEKRRAEEKDFENLPIHLVNEVMYSHYETIEEENPPILKLLPGGSGAMVSCPVLLMVATYGWDVSYEDLTPTRNKFDHYLNFKTVMGTYRPAINLYSLASAMADLNRGKGTLNYRSRSHGWFIFNPFCIHPNSCVPLQENTFLDCPLEYAKTDVHHNPIVETLLTRIAQSSYKKLEFFLSILEAPVCGLLQGNDTDGIVLYENRLFSFQPKGSDYDSNDDPRSLWQFLGYKALDPVVHRTYIARYDESRKGPKVYELDNEDAIINAFVLEVERVAKQLLDPASSSSSSSSPSSSSSSSSNALPYSRVNARAIFEFPVLLMSDSDINPDKDWMNEFGKDSDFDARMRVHRAGLTKKLAKALKAKGFKNTRILSNQDVLEGGRKYSLLPRFQTQTTSKVYDPQQRWN